MLGSITRTALTAALSTALVCSAALPAQAAASGSDGQSTYTVKPTTIASFNLKQNKIRLSDGRVVQYDSNDTLGSFYEYFADFGSGGTFCLREGNENAPNNGIRDVPWAEREAYFEDKLLEIAKAPSHQFYGTVSRSPKGATKVLLGLHYDPRCPAPTS